VKIGKKEQKLNDIVIKLVESKIILKKHSYFNRDEKNVEDFYRF